MNRRWIQMHDYLTLKPQAIEPNKKHLFECKDNKEPSGHSLLVQLAATHSGVVNGNRRFYRPDKMAASVHTWLPNTYARPVLISHDEEGDVIGRVRSAKYVDDRYKYDGNFPILRDTVFYSQDSKRMSVYNSIDWIVSHMMDLDDYTGLGYINLGAQVTNPEAIRKVLDDEYLTVSVGFKTDSAVCSVCHTDWAVEDKCEHRPGEKVDDKQMFLITGNFDYSEVSFVNFPADPFATKLSVDTLKDHINSKFYLGLSPKEQDKLNTTYNLNMSDSLIFESDIDVIYEDQIMDIEFSADSVVNLTKEIKSKELTKERALEIKDALSNWAPLEETDKKKQRSLKSTLNSRIQKEKWSDSEVTTIDAGIEEEINSLVSPTETIISDESCECENWDNYQYTDTEEQAFFEDEDGLYEELAIELEAEGLTDKKLSSESRKKLSKDTFCGPGRSFPVPDCSHVTAARRLIGRAKVSDATKEKILACVSRKAKSLSCGGEKDCTLPNVTPTNLAPKTYSDRVIKSIGGLDISDATASEMVGHLNTLDSAYDSCDDEIKPRVYDAAQAMISDWSTDGYVEWTKKRLSEFDDSLLIVTATDFAEKEEAVNSLTAERDALAASVGIEKTKNIALLSETKKALATQIVFSKVLSKTDSYETLTPEQINDKIAELAKRNIVSLRDTVADLISAYKLTTPSNDQPNEQAKVNDNETVSEEDLLKDKINGSNPGVKSEDTAQDIDLAMRYLSVRDRIAYMAKRNLNRN